MIRRPPRSTQSRSSAASDVYKRQTRDRAARGLFRLRPVRDVLPGLRDLRVQAVTRIRRRIPNVSPSRHFPRILMHADPAGVLTGAHFIDGDHACCEGALAGGCRFVAGYPITPSTEVVERIALRFPEA